MKKTKVKLNKKKRNYARHSFALDDKVIKTLRNNRKKEGLSWNLFFKLLNERYGRE